MLFPMHIHCLSREGQIMYVMESTLLITRIRGLWKNPVVTVSDWDSHWSIGLKIKLPLKIIFLMPIPMRIILLMGVSRNMPNWILTREYIMITENWFRNWVMEILTPCTMPCCRTGISPKIRSFVNNWASTGLSAMDYVWKARWLS